MKHEISFSKNVQCRDFMTGYVYVYLELLLPMYRLAKEQRSMGNDLDRSCICFRPLALRTDLHTTLVLETGDVL